MGALATALLTAGPSLIRAAGALLGGDGKDVADKAADVVEQVTGAADPQAELNKQLAAMTPEQITALQSVKTQLAQIEADREKTRVQAGVAQQAQINETMRTEVQAKDTFKSGWRAAIGWVMALSFLLMTAALSLSVIQDPAQLPDAVSGVMTMAVTMAAVLGVNIHRDGRCREAELTGKPVRTLVDTLRGNKTN